MVRCPCCNGEFDADTINGTTVAECKSCDGLWLSPGDLDHVTGIALEKNLDDWMSEPTECRYCRTPLGFGIECLRCKRHPTLQCPRGHGRMEAAIIEVGDREFEIDRCPSCRGIWIDGHEQEHLDAVPESAREVFRPVPSLSGRTYDTARTVEVLQDLQRKQTQSWMWMSDLGWYPGQRPEPVMVAVFGLLALLALVAIYLFFVPLFTGL